MEVDRDGKYLLMFSREDRPSESWRQFETKGAAYSTSDDVRPKRQVCFRTSCVAKNKSGFENITQFINVICLYRDVWIAAIASSRTSMAPLTGVMCNTSQCELRSFAYIREC